MKLSVCLACVLGPLHVGAAATSLRRQQQHPAEVAARLGQLLVDVTESVHKSGEDAELLFSRIHDQDTKLETGIKREMNSLNSSRAQLTLQHQKYQLAGNVSRRKLSHLNALARNSKDLAVGGEARKLGKQMQTVNNVIEQLQDVEKSGSKELPQAIVGQIKNLLVAQRALRPRFADVYFAYEQGSAKHPVPSKLAGRTVSLLQEIHRRVVRQRAKALLQLSSQQGSQAESVAQAAAAADAARDSMVDEERKSEELASSVAFAESAINLDRQFLAQVEGNADAQAATVEAIRDARKQQLRTLADLADMFNYEYSAPEEEHLAAAAAAASFLQKDEETRPAKPRGGVALQTEIETALRNHGDTHAILMRLNARLNQAAAPLDAKSVHNALAKMGGALRAIDQERDSADEVRQQCQMDSTGSQVEHRLKVNLKLMAVSQNHTSLAIHATQKSLKNIFAKEKALNKTRQDVEQIMEQSVEVLDAQSRDSKTLIAVIEKATQVVPQAVKGGAKRAAHAFFEQLLVSIRTQESHEQTYRTQEAALHENLEEYTHGFEGLLEERRLHYEKSLSALNLYVTELKGDEASRDDLVGDGDDMQAGRAELCSSAVRFFQHQDERRLQVSNALRAALPKLPEVLGADDVEESESGSDDQ